jgi:hypothetical protein
LDCGVDRRFGLSNRGPTRSAKAYAVDSRSNEMKAAIHAALQNERIKNLHLCRVGAFENPLFSTGASRPGFGSHSKVGLQAPSVCWLPAGTPSVRQKDRQVTNTAEVMEAVADFHPQSITLGEVRQAFDCGRLGRAMANALLSFSTICYESAAFSSVSIRGRIRKIIPDR